MTDSEHPQIIHPLNIYQMPVIEQSAALGPGNNGMNAKTSPALTELPFWWREATREEAINVVQKKKAG